MSQLHEVGEPIQNSAYERPTRYWYIREGEAAELREGARRAAVVYPPRDQREPWTLDGRILRAAEDSPGGVELALVNLIRERVAAWQEAGYPGVTRTTLDLLNYWRRDGR
ncbi:MAG TPA: type III restriction endonuclease subunit R, partial [Chloroflexota bacterium]|nr:type III restriction endonuclease subunit R [Chloroflexota bacterium]